MTVVGTTTHELADRAGRTANPGSLAATTRSGTRTTSARTVDGAIAAVALLALGQRQVVAQGVTVGLVVALALAPVWVPQLRHWWGARLLLSTGVLAALAGLWLTAASAADHATSRSNLVGHTALLLGVLCGIGVMLWARSVMPARWVGLWFGAGMLLAAVLGDARLTDNPWKYAFALPVSVLLLSLVDRPRWRLAQVLALLLLAGVSALQDSRSYFATVLLATALFLWRLRPAASRRRASGAWTAAVVGVAAAAIYQLGTTLVLQGYLGEQAQARSVAQVETSGSLLLGGRPELAATTALMRDQPWGFGSGVVPSLHDVLVAKTGMASLNYQPNNGYVENYMFGGEIKLHSVTGDLWASFGAVGLACAAVLAFLLVRTLAVSVARREASALLVLLICWTAWNLAFSPLYSAAPTLALALGLGLLPSRPPVGGDDGDDG